MNPISLLRQFINGLLKDNEPYQIALGLSFGIMIGIIPKNNLTAQILFIFALSTKANVPFLIVSIFGFSLLTPFIDIITDKIGYSILTLKTLEPLFTKMYNTPVIPWTDFNNTVVMGGFILGIFLFLPSYILFKKFGSYYNITLKNKINNSKIVKFLKTSWLFEWYFK